MELIIVITILAILATIAFVSFQWYTKDARDGNRLATITQLQKWLELFATKTANYPTPEAPYTSGFIVMDDTDKETLFEVWYIKEDIARMINFSQTPTDPVSNTNYVYGVTHNRKQYQIAGTLENLQTNFIIPTTYANSYQAHVLGNYNGIVRKWDIFSNPPSLILPYTYQLDWQNLNEETYFVTDRELNLPYKINATTTLTGWTTQTATGIRITKENWDDKKGIIQTELWVSPDVVWVEVFWEKEYYTNIKDEGSSGSTPPEEPTYTLSNCPTVNSARNGTSSTKATILANINNYIWCDISWKTWKIAWFTYSWSTWESKETMVLMVATNDSTSRVWQDPRMDIPELTNITAVTNNSGHYDNIAARDGKANTDKIKTWLNANSQTANRAALECSWDWYLPASEELNQLYCYSNVASTSHSFYWAWSNNANCVSKWYLSTHIWTLSNFLAPIYWSSTQVSDDYSRIQSFELGLRYNEFKSGFFAARCVSRF